MNLTNIKLLTLASVLGIFLAGCDVEERVKKQVENQMETTKTFAKICKEDIDIRAKIEVRPSGNYLEFECLVRKKTMEEKAKEQNQ